MVLKSKKIFLVFATLLVLLSSCFKEDERIQPHPRGNVVVDTIAMGQLYQWQFYYDLSQQKEVSKNDKNNYDLAFECRNDRGLIWLNTAAFMRIKHTGKTDFDAVKDTIGALWKFDKSTYEVDSNALGFLYDTLSMIVDSEVIVVDRGIDAFGNYLGFYKIQLLNYDGQKYTLKYCSLKGTDSKIAEVIKNPAVNYSYLSFKESPAVFDQEPPKEKWDLLFTQYTTLLFTDQGEAYPYLVTGLLTNPYMVEVAEDTIFDFNTITLNQAKNLSYANKRDIIGYDWKDVVGDVTTGNVSYVMRPKVLYVIRDTEGRYFKLRFVGFYSKTGEKGFPAFEFAEL